MQIVVYTHPPTQVVADVPKHAAHFVVAHPHFAGVTQLAQTPPAAAN